MSHDDLLRELRKRGWSLERSGSGHFKARPTPESRCIVIAYSPSCPRGTLNTLARIKRMYGIDLRRN